MAISEIFWDVLDVQVMSAELIALNMVRYSKQFWCKCKIREIKTCKYCKIELKGKSAFRPVTNLGNRMMRICEACMESIAKC